jgi:hypothetical protein
VFLATSTPCQITVDTVELRSRDELLWSAALFAEWSPAIGRDSSPDQFASTSWSRALDRAIGSELEMGIGREAEGESLRVSATRAWASSRLAETSGERVGDDDRERSW